VKVAGSYNHAQAQQVCAGYGYSLPMPKSSYLQSNLQGCLTQDAVWLGLTDSQTESTFRWDDGSSLAPTGYDNWFTNEPNNVGNEE
jgi:polycystin 1L2